MSTLILAASIKPAVIFAASNVLVIFALSMVAFAILAFVISPSAMLAATIVALAIFADSIVH